MSLFSCKSVGLELLVAICLFICALFLDPILVITKALYFLIILEITRMVVEYIKSNTHRVKIRYLVDASVIAVLREVIILVVDSHHLEEHFNILSIYGFLLTFLIGLRYAVMKLSPSDYEDEYKV
jgi:uncharacterized membrane protein (DUF373 family)